MIDTERQLLTNLLGHVALAAQSLQMAFAQLKMAEEKLQGLLKPVEEKK